MSQGEILDSLSANLRKHLDPSGALAPRMMAAKGLVPMPPREMVATLCGLVLDADAQLQGTAQGTLRSLPEKMMLAALEGVLPAAVWAVLAAELQAPTLLEKVVTNRQTPDVALVALAATAPAQIVEILAENQERCLRSEALVRAVRQNPNLARSSLDRLIDFLVRSGIIYDDMPEFADSLGRMSPAELQAAVAQVQLPPQLEILLIVDVSSATDSLMPLEIVEAPAAVIPADDDSAVPEAEVADDSEDTAANAKKAMPMMKLINGLNPAQKVALAMKGNKEARAILLRDSNRVICTAAIRNPQVTEQEIIGAAKSRSISDDVIRIIANSREMSRSYAVKLALVQNPKTPLPTASRILSLLRSNDLRTIAKSKSVPTALAIAARKLLANKQG